MKGASAAVAAILLVLTISAPVLISFDSSADTVTVTFDWNGGEGDALPVKSAEGKDISLPGTAYITSAKVAGTDNSYAFIGWSESDTDTEGVMSYTVPAADVTLYAVWAPSFEIIGYIELDGKAFDRYDISVEVLFGTNPNNPLFTYPFKGVRVDTDGKFSVTVPAMPISSDYGPLDVGSYYLKIHSLTSDGIIGYGIGSLTDKLDKTEISNIFEIDTSGILWTEEYGHEYVITGEIGSMKCITLYVDEKAVGTIRGKVLGDEMYKLSGAVVEVLNSRNEVVSYARSNYGIYEIKDCPVGVYTLRVTALDYESEETEIIQVKSGEVTEYDFSLIPELKNTYLGLDLSHFLMVSGTIVATLLFLSALIVRRRARGNPSFLDNKEE